MPRLTEAERVRRVDRKIMSLDIHSGYVQIKDVHELLAAERRRVVRVVKRELRTLNPTLALRPWSNGYQAACTDILAALRGTR